MTTCINSAPNPVGMSFREFFRGVASLFRAFHAVQVKLFNEPSQTGFG